MCRVDKQRGASQESGLLSYANPNYQLNSSDENCNIETIDEYDDLYEGIDIACRVSRRPGIRNRRKYASLDPVSMGVDLDLETTPMLTTDTENNLNQAESVLPRQEQFFNDNGNSVFDSNENKDMGRKSSFLDYYISLETSSQKQKNIPAFQTVCNSDSSSQKSPTPSSADKDYVTVDAKGQIHSDGVYHVQSPFSEDSCSVPHKTCILSHEEKPSSLLNIPVRFNGSSNSEKVSFSESDDNDFLPTGWEKHEDDSGPYYWHISSGTIQREPPVSMDCNKTPTRMAKDFDLMTTRNEFCANSYKTSSCSINLATDSTCNSILRMSSIDEKLKRRSCPDGSCSLTQDKRPIRFAVRSLGWVEIAEADLTPERSSKAVNKCIVDLSMGRNDILDVVGRWGDGKDLFMDLDDYSLRLMDTQDLTVLNTQPIHTIRVWGVGRDNGRERDFAYVARDRVTKKHMCHVFRCDIPARIIANTLRDICKKIMIEKSLQRSMEKGNEAILLKKSENSNSLRGTPTRPTDLPMEQHQFQHSDSNTYTGPFFPTPMEEPKKVLKVHYLGSINVKKATGVEILNDAIEQLTSSLPLSEYKYVNVAVAPSTITISELGEEGKQLAECRVRFLSFLGIGKNVKNCGFIVHTAQDDFVAHVFHCEPSSGALCKTIEAACKLRYQKCLDAHRQDADRKKMEAQRKGLGTTLKNAFGTFFLTRLTKSAET
ncbi:protein Fe65 homolog [Uloborus diversus]|uniref:protein Fe65 homolog n=1 Tax=Uloborus diversus TaxID=327109 RepID=UPI002409C22F|nr:protein Fe65 homolog [Uloborus diversus]